MFALTQGLRRAVQTKPNGISTQFASRRRTWQQTSDRVSPDRRRTIRAGRATRRPRGHPGAEQRPLFRADVRHSLDRRRHGADQHAAGGAGDRVHPVRLRRRRAVHRHRHGAPPDALEGKMPGVREVVWLDDIASPGLRITRISPTTNRHSTIGAANDDLAGLFYTGGTTGRSKGVMLSHTNLVVNALNAVAGIGFTRDTTYIHSGPMFHLADGASTFGVTMAGGRHAFVPRFDRPRCCRPSSREGDARAVRADHDQHAGQPSALRRVRHPLARRSSCTAPRRCPRACCARPCK